MECMLKQFFLSEMDNGLLIPPIWDLLTVDAGLRVPRVETSVNLRHINFDSLSIAFKIAWD